MFGHATVEKESEAEEVYYTKIQSDDYSRLSNVVGGRYLLSTNGINQLSTAYNFTQIRIRCSKPYHGRTLDIVTTTTSKGTFARDWLLRRRSEYLKPPSCGSYERLPQDTSYLGGHCEDWEDSAKDGVWNYNHLYYYPMEAFDGNVWHEVSLLGDRYDWCDDDDDHPHYSNVGKWSYFIR